MLLQRKSDDNTYMTQDMFHPYYQRRLQKLTDVLHDKTHPLKMDFNDRFIQSSGRRNIIRVPLTKTTRYDMRPPFLIRCTDNI